MPGHPETSPHDAHAIDAPDCPARQCSFCRRRRGWSWFPITGWIHESAVAGPRRTGDEFQIHPPAAAPEYTKGNWHLCSAAKGLTETAPRAACPVQVADPTET